MYKKIVIPVILLLFVLQTSNLLFADENTEAKTEVKTEAISEKETKAKPDTAAVAETEAKAEAGTEAVAGTDIKTEEGAEAAEAAEAVAETENDVIATVNGEEIFRKELDRRLGVLKRMNQEVTRAVQIQVINQLTKKVLLKQFVEGQNIDVSDGAVQESWKRSSIFCNPIRIIAKSRWKRY